MGRLPWGRKNPHVCASYGPDTDLMKFYSTIYSTKYGKDPFTPRYGKHVGTGYQSNFRPGVYYTKRLDDLDNPAMGRIVADNYHSITTKHYQSSRDSDGTDPLPCNLHMPGSGFVRQVPITTPIVRDVHSVCVDTRDHGPGITASGVLPKHKPRLHHLRSKDPVELENVGHGPRFMSTETHERFQGMPHAKLNTQHKSVGNNEETGYTHAYNIEPITFHPASPHKNVRPGWMTDRPIGNRTIMKTDYQPSEYLRGNEKLPVVIDRSTRDTGFTREVAKPLYVNPIPGDAYTKLHDVPEAARARIQKGDPAEYLNLTHPNNHSSMAMKAFQGQQRPSPSECDRLAKTAIGLKESSGYSSNQDKEEAYGEDDPRRWLTHYDTRFWDMNPKGKARAGRTFGSVMEHLPNGFTRSTAVHTLGDDIDTTAQLRHLHPYVARSIKATDTFYDDHTHDTKKHPHPPLLTRSLTVA
ncbi:stabilizer of axonemal microtubules 4-like [Saccoglossus kowalevskii]|uniref:Protein phosphatase 1 regulatory subunit 32-like isoform X1 n=1 Tax=Saccoglossus kowalevskii TaxID=10224 RepID=A0ABM0GYP5_SACKO|nr:PREDICTED: protein phosphatase 1 regulatory subunit 32-like isoform X1 [Saccoglossus kowalevskii]